MLNWVLSNEGDWVAKGGYTIERRIGATGRWRWMPKHNGEDLSEEDMCLPRAQRLAETHANNGRSPWDISPR